MNDIEFEWLYRNFPKHRPTLPTAYQALYLDEYKRNRDNHNSTLQFKQKLEHWMHRQVANATAPKGALLEIGAGTLNHIRWEDSARPYDIVEPFTSLFEEKEELSHLRNTYKNIFTVPTDARYSKILSIAVLEHLADLPQVIAKSALLLSDNGVMVNGLPSEGGLLWYLAWRLGTGLSFRIRTGLSYTKLMRHEHINNAEEILRVLYIFFDDVRYKRFPLPLLHGSFYTFIQACSPRKQRAQQFLGIDL
jgi:hypothetical protein